MPRPLRFIQIGVPQHVIQRGNNREKCFTSDNDRQFYLNCLFEYSAKYDVDILAWVLMTNHVHLLCTSQLDGGISKMMQSIGRKYVRYYNKVNERTGTLWEGRFKSTAVETERYFIEVHKYIEFNPVKAGIVSKPEDYKWSSAFVIETGSVKR